LNLPGSCIEWIQDAAQIHAARATSALSPRLRVSFQKAPPDGSRLLVKPPCAQEISMIILGIILLIIGFVAKIAILWSIGIAVLVIGLILVLLGTMGHAVGGRRHYW
jgi:hypothetical protein